MSRATKTTRVRLLPRKTAAGRAFPAWIDSEARAAALPAVVEARVRDNLVLRLVAQGKTVHPRNPSDVRRSR
jgi:hypothetical protein